MTYVIYTSPTGEPLCTTEQAASQLSLSPGYLVSCRSKNSIPLKFTKVGKRVFYRKADVDAFIASRGGA